ncbi:unnamed protein product [Notodromas monacha]|uniref:Uncharacterized protein n=1 Tax=Notodromas monacha TaxID=399045 RepID=A0A7R9BI85_9CRUS|nr:unnamed protein product [Notodromas monacha]CAG0915712.1 unnamed protein product [Notodromas monacha]
MDGDGQRMTSWKHSFEPGSDELTVNLTRLYKCLSSGVVHDSTSVGDYFLEGLKVTVVSLLDRSLHGPGVNGSSGRHLYKGKKRRLTETYFKPSFLVQDRLRRFIVHAFSSAKKEVFKLAPQETFFYPSLSLLLLVELTGYCFSVKSHDCSSDLTSLALLTIFKAVFGKYVGSFPVAGSDELTRSEIVKLQLNKLHEAREKGRPVLIVISVAGIKVCSPDGKVFEERRSVYVIQFLSLIHSEVVRRDDDDMSSEALISGKSQQFWYQKHLKLIMFCVREIPGCLRHRRCRSSACAIPGICVFPACLIYDGRVESRQRGRVSIPSDLLSRLHFELLFFIIIIFFFLSSCFPVVVVVNVVVVKNVYMAHALKRISYASCDPELSHFSFLAREPKGQMDLQFCHAFLAESPEQSLGIHPPPRSGNPRLVPESRQFSNEYFYRAWAGYNDACTRCSFAASATIRSRVLSENLINSRLPPVLMRFCINRETRSEELCEVMGAGGGFLSHRNFRLAGSEGKYYGMLMLA